MIIFKMILILQNLTLCIKNKTGKKKYLQKKDFQFKKVKQKKIK